MSKLLSIGAAAKTFGVSTSTLRRWEAVVGLVPIRTEGGPRRYDLAALRPGRPHGATVPRRTVANGRMSSQDQRADLEREQQGLELYCAAQDWPFDIIADLGSAMNYHKRGLRRLLDEIVAGDVGRSHRNQKLIDGVRGAVQEAQC